MYVCLFLKDISIFYVHYKTKVRVKGRQQSNNLLNDLLFIQKYVRLFHLMFLVKSIMMESASLLRTFLVNTLQKNAFKFSYSDTWFNGQMI